MSQVHSKEDLEYLSIYEGTKAVQNSLATQIDQLISSDLSIKLGNIYEQLTSKKSNESNVTNTTSVQFEKNIYEIKMLDHPLESFPDITSVLKLIDEYLSTDLRASDEAT